MRFEVFLPFGAALISFGLALLVLVRDRRSFVHRTFAAGMIALAVEQIFSGLSFLAALPQEILLWQRLRLLAAAFLPGTWLLFSLSFARANYKEIVAKWKWVALAAFGLPLALTTVLSRSLFIGLSLGPSSAWLLDLGWPGYGFNLTLLLCAVLILMNLERTLRASTGSLRWQLKFMVLGVGGLFAVRVYTSSQALLYSSVDSGLAMVNTAALIVADALIVVSLIRVRQWHFSLYLSHAALYNSVTVVIAGAYLLTIGALAKAAVYFGGNQDLVFGAFFVFLALLGLALVLLSDELRQHIKRLVVQHLRRPRYDYRKEWTALTRRTSSIGDTRGLCVAVAKAVSATFGVSSVGLWLLNETKEQLVLAGATVFSEAQRQGLGDAATGIRDLIRIIREQEMPIDLDRSDADWVAKLKRFNLDYFRETRTRYCVPLVAGAEILGMMTLSDRVTKEPFTLEDFDLLKTIADQAAASLLNLRLAEHLMQAKEMEAFQTLSAFFVHDLKNLASTLSVMMENLPIHFDNPAFRNDAIRMTSRSVAKINSMCSRLASFSNTLDLQRVEMDAKGLVGATLATLNGCIKASLIQDLQPVPRLLADPEELQKVLVNLILNADEATGAHGQIRVGTAHRNGYIVLSVADNGCGMSREFMEHSLFHPFRTTKKKGLGIGLFQCKHVVEAHGGRIEVESEEGKGSTFRVVLPVEAKG